MVGFVRKVIISKYSVFSSLPIREREGIYSLEANFFIFLINAFFFLEVHL